jgi:tRNA(fMet)-specific endonuclease VapC
MSFLLDTDTCSAHLKRPAGLTHRFIQHSGRLFVSSIVLGELYAWAYRRSSPQRLVDRIEKELLPDVFLLDFDRACAIEFGQLRGDLLRRGIAVSRSDLLIATTARVHGLTLVTHNTRDFKNIPGLRLDDWLLP